MAGVMLNSLLGAVTGIALVAAAPRLGFRAAPQAGAGRGRSSAGGSALGSAASLARRAHNRRTVALVVAASAALAALVHVAENALS